jgi:hypothetical protein
MDIYQRIKNINLIECLKKLHLMAAGSFVFNSEESGVAPFSPIEYASKFEKLTDLRIEFIDAEESAMVDLIDRVIYLPIQNSTNPFAYQNYRIAKALLCHECSHLLYPDNSYFLHPNSTPHEKCRFYLCQTLDDLRIEALLELEYSGIREDFKFLAEKYWDKEKSKDFSSDLMGSLYWLLQKQYRGVTFAYPYHFYQDSTGNFLNGMEIFIIEKLVPFLDTFTKSRNPVLPVADKMLEKIKVNWPDYFAVINRDQY